MTPSFFGLRNTLVRCWKLAKKCWWKTGAEPGLGLSRLSVSKVPHERVVETLRALAYM